MRDCAAEALRLRRTTQKSDQEELPPAEFRGGGREEQPHVQGAVDAWAQEGQEELLHVQGQERQQ